MLSWQILALVSLPAWVLLWASLNATFDDLRYSSSITSVRAAFPLVVVAVALLFLPVAVRRSVGSLRGPLAFLLLYAVVGIVASVLFSPDRATAFYWGFAFLGPALLLGLLTVANPDPRSFSTLLRINWIFASVLFTLLLFQGLLQQDLWVRLDPATTTRLYGARPADPDTLWATANGVGRFGAVLGLVAVSRLLGNGRKFWPVWVVLLLWTCLGLYVTISRSSIFGFGVAVLVLVFLHRGAKVALGVGGLGLLGALITGLGDNISNYFLRGGGWEVLASFSGRTEAWEAAIAHLKDSPLIGFGFHADRLLVAEHAHNAILHATIQAGIIGGILFIGAWVWTWRLVFGLGILKRFNTVPLEQRPLLIEACALLTFFTLRSLPESTAAFFGVDLLIVAPLMAYVYVSAASTSSLRATAMETSRPQGQPTKVLVSAYACTPPGSASFHGGEELLGWQMVQQLGRFHDVWVLCSAEHRTSIEEEQAKRPNVQVRFVYVDLPRRMKTWRDRQGGIQFYAYLWQVRAFFVALRLHQEVRFGLFHHLTYANDWMASHIGALLPIPYVRGPGGGAHRIPTSFLAGRGLRFRLAQWSRTAMQRLLRLDPFFLISQERARLILLCNREAFAALAPRWKPKAQFFPVNGMDFSAAPRQARAPTDERFTVLSVGKLLGIKGFDLAIRAFASFAEHRDGRLVVVGEGPERARLERLARETGLSDRILFAGWRSHDEVLEMMRASDVFLFAGLRDGGGAVVIEAMAMGCPVVCLDIGGPGLHVTRGTGIKVAASSPETAVHEMATALRALHASPAMRRAFGRAAKARAVEHYDWNRLGDRLRHLMTNTSKETSRPPIPPDKTPKSSRAPPREAPA